MSDNKPKITRNEARRWLAVLLYPKEMAGDNDAKRVVRNRLRNRIDRAVESGEITTTSNMADVPFCLWLRKEYQISPQEWFPEAATRTPIETTIILPWRGLPHIPDDPNELREWAIERWSETRELEKRIKELENDNQALRDRLSKWGRPKDGY